MSDARVTGLWIYPVKSCRGLSLKEMQIGPTGPVHDREWMIVDQDNQFLTLRTNSKLSEIQTSLQGPFLHMYLGSNKMLIDTQTPFEKIETVTVWKDSFLAGVATKDINEALSDFLSQSVKLVRYQKESFRDIHQYATEAVKETMFADGHAALLTNVATLKNLNAQLTVKGESPSVMERFRSNIIIEGLDAFSEDKVKEFKIGDIVFKNPKLCVRCVIINQDVETGHVVSKETLKTLAEHHKPQSQKPTFGINLTPASHGMIRVGDSVEILG